METGSGGTSGVGSEGEVTVDEEGAMRWRKNVAKAELRRSADIWEADDMSRTVNQTSERSEEGWEGAEDVCEVRIGRKLLGGDDRKVVIQTAEVSDEGYK